MESHPHSLSIPAERAPATTATAAPSATLPPSMASHLLAALFSTSGSKGVLRIVAPMTVKQFAAFLMVAFQDRPYTVGALADRLSTTAPVITRALDRLEGMRLVSRARSTTDRRVVLLRLTRKGEEVARMISDLVDTSMVVALDGVKQG